jgi:hypothetical protein
MSKKNGRVRLFIFNKIEVRNIYLPINSGHTKIISTPKGCQLHENADGEADPPANRMNMRFTTTYRLVYFVWDKKERKRERENLLNPEINSTW